MWTISLIYHDYYSYRVGQYAPVGVRNSVGTPRAYTTFSTPGVSEYITLTVWRTDDGIGSQWLTRDVKRGNCLWLSDTMGEFTCDDKVEDRFLLLVAGCGTTPTISMCRWLAKNRPQADVWVVYNVRTPQDAILADGWRNYPVALVAEDNATEGFIAGCLTRKLLAGVPDLASCAVMTCSPAPYMDWVEQEVKAFGVTRLLGEKFFTSVTETMISDLEFTKLQPARESYAPVGTTLLEVPESNNVPVVAAHRAGVCGCCETKVVSDEYTVSSMMTLTDTEIAEGYVLACSYHPWGDLVLA